MTNRQLFVRINKMLLILIATVWHIANAAHGEHGKAIASVDLPGIRAVVSAMSAGGTRLLVAILSFTAAPCPV